MANTQIKQPEFHRCPNLIVPWERKTPWQKLVWWYDEYLSNLCLNVMEPWQRAVFNTVMLGTIGLVGYTAVVYFPVHLRGLIEITSLLANKVGPFK